LFFSCVSGVSSTPHVRKRETDEVKEQRKTEQRRIRRKKEGKKNLVSSSYGGNKDLPVLL
jgi:hypothetical protein